MGVWGQQVAASNNHSFFVDSHGWVWGCGHNLYQQLGLSAPHTTTSAMKFPCKVDVGSDRVSAHLVCTMHCGKRVGIACATHIGFRASAQNNAWEIGYACVLKISTSERHTMMVTETGTVWYMGEARRGQGM